MKQGNKEFTEKSDVVLLGVIYPEIPILGSSHGQSYI